MSVKITTKKAKPTYEKLKNLGSGAVWCGKVNTNFTPDNEVKFYQARVERECPYLHNTDDWDNQDCNWYLPSDCWGSERAVDAVKPMKKGDIITYNKEIGIYFCKKCAKANKKHMIENLMYMVEKIKKGDIKYEIIDKTAEEEKCPCCKKSYELRVDADRGEMIYFDYHKIHGKKNHMMSEDICDRIDVIEALEEKYIIPFTENEKVSCDKCFNKIFQTYYYTDRGRRRINIQEYGEERSIRKAETRLRKEFLRRTEAVRIIENAYWNTHTELGKRIFMNRLKADGIDDAFDE